MRLKIGKKNQQLSHTKTKEAKQNSVADAQEIEQEFQRIYTPHARTLFSKTSKYHNECTQSQCDVKSVIASECTTI